MNSVTARPLQCSPSRTIGINDRAVLILYSQGLAQGYHVAQYRGGWIHAGRCEGYVGRGLEHQPQARKSVSCDLSLTRVTHSLALAHHHRAQVYVQSLCNQLI
jgi:hypothetical protein